MGLNLEGKIIKKKIFHSILILITVLVSIVVTLFIAVQDPIIQRFAVRFAGGYLSEKTGADIRIGRIAVSPDLRLFVNEVSVKDLEGNDLAKINRLRAKVYVGELLDGRVHLRNVELRDAEANLIKYEGAETFNYQFLADFFASGSEKEKDPNKPPTPFFIDHVSLQNVKFVMWDQNKSDPAKTAQNAIDYSHLALDNVNLEARHFALVGDSVYTVVEKLSAKEHCGLDLKHFQSDVVFCRKGVFLKDMQMETNNSLFHMDLDMRYNSFEAFSHFVDSVMFDATIYPTDVLLSDIGYFAPIMYKMPNRVHLEGKFTGPIEHFRLNDMDLRFGKNTSIQGNISMHPLDFEDGYHTLDIKKLRFSYNDLAQFHIPGSSGTIPLPESLNVLESGNTKLDFKGSYNNFVADIALTSDIGDLSANISRNKQNGSGNVFSGNIDTKGIDVGLFANASNILGKLDMSADFTAKFPEEGDPELDMNGSLLQVELLGNHINEIKLNGAMKENRFNGQINIADDELALDFNGLIDFSDPKQPKSDFDAIVHHADLRSLNILKTDSIAEISTRIYANMSGFDIDNLEGTLHLDSTVYRNNQGEYVLKSFDARIVNDNLMQRRININSDFFGFEMAGVMNFASLLPSLNAYGVSFVRFPVWEGNLVEFEQYKASHDTEQDFFFDLTLKDTQTLSRLFMPSLHVAPNTSFRGTFTSRNNALNLTARSKKIQYGDLEINNLELKNFNRRSAAFGTLSLGEVVWRNITKTDTLAFGLDNLLMSARMANDSIATTITWDDVSSDDHNKALIETVFVPHESGGKFSIGKADIVINDSLWRIVPANSIDFDNGRVEISNICFSHQRKSLKIDGYVPMNESDTLLVEMKEFDVSMFDFVTGFFGFDPDGRISGTAQASNLKNDPIVLADLAIEGFGMDGESVGDVMLHSNWDNEAQSVNVDAGIMTKEKQALHVLGSYYTNRKEDNLDFNVKMDSLQLAVINPFVGSQISRVQGFGVGNIAVTGSLKAPELHGTLAIRDGGCKVTYLNTYYSFSPTISIDSRTIALKDMVLVDTLGNKATVTGSIKHNFLKDFYLDINLYLREFLAMATTAKHNDLFYGSVVADGMVNVRGALKDIALDVKASTRKGTFLTLPLNGVSTVSDNDFIVFVNPNETDEMAEEEMVEEKTKSNFGINLDVNVKDEAEIKIMLPGDIGTIDATGHGNLKLGTSSATSMTMFGEYVINSGRFHLNLMDVVMKYFTLKKGGTISWSGSPTDGRINATGVYTVKTSLATLGIQVDSMSSAANNNITAECLIHLKDALLNPTITFGLNLPNASEDVKQTVYSLIDTTNQAVMSSQALSLLVLGAFKADNSSLAGGNALGGLSNNLLGSVLNLELTKDMSLGFNYYSGSGNNSYDEMLTTLKMELFENRLIVETNFGVITSNSMGASEASNFVGEVDAKLKLSKDGRLMAHFYNHSNYNNNYSSLAFDKLAPYTQGLGLTYSKSFDSFKNLFKRKKTVQPGRPMINRPTTNKR